MDIQSKLANATKAVLESIPASERNNAEVVTAFSNGTLFAPYILVNPQGASEFPWDSGNYNASVAVEIYSPMEPRNAIVVNAHGTTVQSVFAKLDSGTLAVDLTNAIPGTSPTAYTVKCATTSDPGDIIHGEVFDGVTISTGDLVLRYGSNDGSDGIYEVDVPGDPAIPAHADPADYVTTPYVLVEQGTTFGGQYFTIVDPSEVITGYITFVLANPQPSSTPYPFHCFGVFDRQDQPQRVQDRHWVSHHPCR